MSNLVYGGYNTGGSTVTVSGGGIGGVSDYFREAKKRQYQQQVKANFNANNYNHTNTNTYSVDDILKGDINAVNPYKKEVILSGTDTVVVTGYIDIYYPNGGRARLPIFSHIYSYNIGINQGYVDYEKAAFDAQKQDYESKYSTGLTEFSNSVTNGQISDAQNYDNDRFGDTALINSLTNELVALENQIFEESYSDTHTSDYNRIKNTSSSEMQVEQAKDIADIQAKLTDAKNAYDTKSFQTRLKELRAEENAKKEGEWQFDVPQYIPTPVPIDLSQLLKPTFRQDINGFTQLFLSGDINSWMAGGNLYDAPRAGDVMFNVMGNMNTVRFLGLEDTNKFPDIVKEFANPEVYKMFGPLAGDSNFSVIPPTLYE